MRSEYQARVKRIKTYINPRYKWLLICLFATIGVSGQTKGPLTVGTNSHWFVDNTGKAIALSGSHTWNDFQDLSQISPPSVTLDFTAYVSFLQIHGHNATILWRKDLPTYCGWGAGGTWHDATWPWPRTGAGNANDGQPQFDLSQFNQAYFDRLRTRVQALQAAGIYAIVQLFDGYGIIHNRCPGSDGYPFTSPNNINSIDDGGSTGSMTMTASNAITNVQDAYVRKAIDTLHDLDNVIWEQSEEAPNNSTWWQGHMISLIHTYEASQGYPHHPVLYAMLDASPGDSTYFSSAAEAVAPGTKIMGTNNQGKVVINDSDHNYFGMWNDSAQTNRNYFWENFSNGNSTIFMDPYEIYWSSGNRNLCGSPVNGVCSSPDPRWNNLRDNLGQIANYGSRMNLAIMTPQPGLSSTGYALANASATGEYLVYAPNGGSFTVNLSATPGNLSVEWYNPSTGSVAGTGTITGGSTVSFTPSFGGDAVLYLKQKETAPNPPTNLQVVVSLLSLPVITTISPLPAGTVNTAYNVTLQASGGIPPYNWTISGSLPTGLTLNGSTGIISGTPTSSGTYSFTVQVSDSLAQSASKALSLVVAAASTALFSDGFESGTANNWDAGAGVRANNNFTIVSSGCQQGTYCGQINLGQGGCCDNLFWKSAGFESSDVYFRAWFKFSAGFLAGNNDSVNGGSINMKLMYFQGGPSNVCYLTSGPTTHSPGGAGANAISIYGLCDHDGVVHHGYTFTFDNNWHEVEVRLSSTNHVYQAWWDGVQFINATDNVTQGANIQSWGVGVYENNQFPQAESVTIDNVAVCTARCQ